MEGVGRAHLYPALAWSICAPGHHGYPRAPDLILGKALRGAWVTRSRVRRRDRFSISSIQLADLGGYLLVLLVDACFVAACLHQHGPGDPRQLISKGSSQHVVMQAVCRGPKLCLAQFAGLSKITRAPCMNSVR